VARVCNGANAGTRLPPSGRQLTDHIADIQPPGWADGISAVWWKFRPYDRCVMRGGFGCLAPGPRVPPLAAAAIERTLMHSRGRPRLSDGPGLGRPHAGAISTRRTTQTALGSEDWPKSRPITSRSRSMAPVR
jgi:hypothetical protein